FSCRRRHTRFSRDWSSDVCSSDLLDASWKRIARIYDILLRALPDKRIEDAHRPPRSGKSPREIRSDEPRSARDQNASGHRRSFAPATSDRQAAALELERREIGRASCRERV